MEAIHKRLDRIEFHMRLLAKMEEEGECPFYRLVIDRGLTEAEVSEVFQLCVEVNQKMHEQIEEGLLNRSTLLTHFVGMLNIKLDPLITIKALLAQEETYRELMETLLKVSPYR
ncbi:DUF1878 family protein [Bacillus sp. N1-1]|jgi:hypothetical protein|uniref:DUF1878 family protein n=1 Tax=Bacillus sp. N1-1 TaxID=2682541 RepID=UPI0013190A8E|nr:DUF1878 family protein [Bacillus sp. N1-1]QHA90491.1 DUF1878 family protein [Bacillus sp. N1-1]